MPVLMMTAQDDPFVPYDVFQRAESRKPASEICDAEAWWALRVHFEVGRSGAVLGGSRELRNFAKKKQ